jgi:hypothetical protein
MRMVFAVAFMFLLSTLFKETMSWNAIGAELAVLLQAERVLTELRARL